MPRVALSCRTSHSSDPPGDAIVGGPDCRRLRDLAPQDSGGCDRAEGFNYLLVVAPARLRLTSAADRVNSTTSEGRPARLRSNVATCQTPRTPGTSSAPASGHRSRCPSHGASGARSRGRSRPGSCRPRLKALAVLNHVLGAKRLVGEAHVHHAGRVALGGGQVDQPAIAQQVELAPVGEVDTPRRSRGPAAAAGRQRLQRRDVDLVVEVAASWPRSRRPSSPPSARGRSR